jgi:hypothetical protein
MAIGSIGRMIGSSLAPEAGEALPIAQHGAFGYESSLPASKPGYWSGFLEGVKDAAKYAGRSIVILGAAAAAALTMADNAYAQPIPDDFRLNPDYTNVGELDKYTSVRKIELSGICRPFGDVNDANGVPIHFEPWLELTFVDEGGQVIGQIFTNGRYDFRFGNPEPYQFDNFGLYGDGPEDGDQGASPGDHITIIARRLDNNKRYRGMFINGPLATGYQAGIIDKCDIQIFNNEPNGIPFVPTCGFHEHPYPEGDLDHNCKVDFYDFAIMAEHWLESTEP